MLKQELSRVPRTWEEDAKQNGVSIVQTPNKTYRSLQFALWRACNQNQEYYKHYMYANKIQLRYKINDNSRKNAEHANIILNSKRWQFSMKISLQRKIFFIVMVIINPGSKRAI